MSEAEQKLEPRCWLQLSQRHHMFRLSIWGRRLVLDCAFLWVKSRIGAMLGAMQSAAAEPEGRKPRRVPP